MITALIAIHIAFFLWIVVNRLFLPALPKQPSVQADPFVSILVPMRNEERNVPTIVRSLKETDW